MARILIIDDDQTVRNVLRRILMRDGHDVIEVSDGADALRALEDPDLGRPDAIITDVFMPEMDGIEFLLQLGEVAPGIPAIVISGGGMMGPQHVLEDAQQLGAAATLRKPFTPDDVSEVLARVMAKPG